MVGTIRDPALGALGCLASPTPWAEISALCKSKEDVREFMHSLKTGRSSFDHVFVMPVFEWFCKNPTAPRSSTAELTELTNLVAFFAGCPAKRTLSNGLQVRPSLILGVFAYPRKKVQSGISSRLEMTLY
jgi:hypothetical protein